MTRRPALPLLSLILAVFFCLGAPVAEAASSEAQNYHRAFSALDNNHAEQALSLGSRGHDPVLNQVLRGYAMAAPGNDFDFAEMADFVSSNPDWPGLRGILMIAEQKIPANATPTQVINWFTAHPPLTLVGFYRDIDALNAAGQTQNIARLIRARWIDGDFSADEFVAFRARFGRFLDVDSNWARLDRLLWKNDINGARRMYGIVDENMKNVSEARILLANQVSDAEAQINRIPDEWKNDPGLLYERMRWRVRNNMDDEANDLLLHAPQDLGKAEAWWEQRQIMIHRAIGRKDYSLAYKLAADHGQKDGKTLIQAEFLAGWLALRFINHPEQALDHFQALYDNAQTPVSRARGAYWLGRTYEVLNDKNNAEQSYENAAALNISYYGQLATARIYKDPIVVSKPEPSIPASVHAAFFNRNLIQAVKRLYGLGETDRARIFFHAALDAAFQRSDFVMLTELAYQMRRPDLAIEAAKAANQKNMLMASSGFPIFHQAVPTPPELAFTHALIRQESMFNPDATSPVGAHGLMQLMPSTAKYIAKKEGIKFKESRLGETDYNLRLGTAFIQNQLDMFNGSYILALAGYNAGPGRVRQWMQQIGDPRNPDIDPIDWVESIPVSETRNYVQRIIESLQIYRARLNGGQAPLFVLRDLKR